MDQILVAYRQQYLIQPSAGSYFQIWSPDPPKAGDALGAATVRRLTILTVSEPSTGVNCTESAIDLFAAGAVIVL